MKKLKRVFVVLGTALIAVFAMGLAACGDSHTTKVKNETQWKEAIAEVCNSDYLKFSISYKDADTRQTTMALDIQTAGKTQYFRSRLYDTETGNVTDTIEYYYDGEYAYPKVKGKDGFDAWKKVDLKTAKEEYPEPKSYLNEIYAGEFGEIDFDKPEKLAERYADAKYNEKGDSRYYITDGNTKYDLYFGLGKDSTELSLSISSKLATVSYNMGDTSVKVVIPKVSEEAAE